MTQRVKDKIIGAIIGTSSSLVVGIILIFVSGMRADAKAFKNLVNDKLDKIEFEQFLIKNKEELERIELQNASGLENMEKRLKDYYDTRHEDLKDFMKEINKLKL